MGLETSRPDPGKESGVPQCSEQPVRGSGGEDRLTAEAEAGALYGTPDEIAAKLQALRDVGAEYVLLNSQGGLPSLRRFARDLMPAFAGAPAVAANA